MYQQALGRVAAGVALVVALAGCTGQAASGNPTPTAAESAASTQVAAGPLPACANAGAAIAIPAAFPSKFPMLPGTVINATENRTENRIVVSGVAPMTVQQAAEYWERELPNAQFKMTDAESEPGEAEGSFAGNGVKGRFKVNDIPNCPNTLTLSIVVGPQ